MADMQVARCDGGEFGPHGEHLHLDAQTEPCPATLEIIGDNSYRQKLHFQSEGWLRREFRGGMEHDALVRWWSFCPEHVKKAVERFYLAQFSDDGE
jgi:hypothetical protein